MSIAIKTTFAIAAGPALVSGTHEGCAVKITAAGTVGLCADDGIPAGIVESIDTAANTCVVVRFGYALARIGATVTPGTHYWLASAADSRLDPAGSGTNCVGYIIGADAAADTNFIPIIVHPRTEETA